MLVISYKVFAIFSIDTNQILHSPKIFCVNLSNSILHSSFLTTESIGISKTLVKFTRLYGVTSRKTVVFIFTTVEK
jgi:hypothetical protein